MFERLKKRSVVKSIPVVLLFLAIGIGLIVLEFNNVKSMLAGSTQFEQLQPDEIKEGMIVDITLKENFGVYAEAYEENTTTHAQRTTDLYYVIWTGDDEAEDFRYMGIKVGASEMKKLDEMAEAFYYGEATTPVEYSGKIQKMTDEEYKYFEDYFEEAGMTAADIDAWTLPYFINVGALVGGGATTAWVFFGAGIVCVLIAIIRLIVAMSGGSLKTVKKELAVAGIDERDVDTEFESARSFDKKGDIRIGNKLTFYLVGSKPHVISNDKIVWAYQKATTHRTNGIKTGTTYAVVVNTYDKKTHHIAVDRESESLEMLQHINDRMPWVVVGYDNELNRMYNKEYQNFLQLRYNNQGQAGQF